MDTTATTLDVRAIRRDFPALTSGLAFFDAPGGSQTPTPVIEAIAAALSAPLSNRGPDNPAQRNAEQIVRDARSAMADYLGDDPSGIVFGRSATQLTLEFARTLARDWAPGDEVVVTRLDHDGNIRPWLLAAERVGATVRWLDFDPATAELDLDQLEAILTPRTRLVAVTGASNLLGTIPDHPRIAEAVHRAGALLWVDAVHLAAHVRVDRAALGADIVVCSPYKFCGPHLGVLAADPDLLAGLRPDKLLPSSDAVPERFELGTLPYELLAGTTAAVNYLAGLGEGDDRPTRLTRRLRPAGRERARAAEPAGAGAAGPGRHDLQSGGPTDVDGAVRSAGTGRRSTCPSGSPPRGSPPRPGASTRSRRRDTSDSGTTVPSAPDSPRTPTPATWTGCSMRSTSALTPRMAQRGPAAAS